jgi:hypothetical protein
LPSAPDRSSALADGEADFTQAAKATMAAAGQRAQGNRIG